MLSTSLPVHEAQRLGCLTGVRLEGHGFDSRWELIFPCPALATC